MIEEVRQVGPMLYRQCHQLSKSTPQGVIELSE